MGDGELSGSSSWKARFSSTEPIASVTIGNDCGNGGISYWRKSKGRLFTFLRCPLLPFEVKKSTFFRFLGIMTDGRRGAIRQFFLKCST